MPPRKRAETKPEPPEGVEANGTETPEPDATEGTVEPAAEPDGPEDAVAPPAKSDLQTVDLPCSACFPNGWPDSGFGLGCEHGTWYRKS